MAGMKTDQKRKRSQDAAPAPKRAKADPSKRPSKTADKQPVKLLSK
jgi:hypothetical protein